MGYIGIMGLYRDYRVIHGFNGESNGKENGK